MSASGFWGGRFERAFFDVRVHMLGRTDNTASQPCSYRKHESIKRRTYVRDTHTPHTHTHTHTSHTHTHTHTPHTHTHTHLTHTHTPHSWYPRLLSSEALEGPLRDLPSLLHLQRAEDDRHREQVSVPGPVQEVGGTG